MNFEDEYCILVDWTGTGNPFLFEKVKRFLETPPHYRWKMWKRNLTEKQAWDWVTNSEEAEEIYRQIMNESITKEIPKGIRFDILQRDGFKCCICGRGAADGVRLEVDHKYPKSKGGTDNLSNLWTLCFQCNRGKSAKQLHKTERAQLAVPLQE